MTVEYIPPPSSRDLLPPLLACLSTASASKQPPPGLLPLLSPILRQRVQLLASDDWLTLLSWDNQIASKLPQTVNKIKLEPHPVSGEIETEEPDEIVYRRSDPETLHSRLVLGEYGLIPTFLWCTGGDSGNAWKLSELRGIENKDDGTDWFQSITEANEAGFRRSSVKASGTHNTIPQPPPQPEEDDEDDDDYWAAYDRTPGRTPHKRSPAPVTNSKVQLPTQTELEYFARYAAEVQPALDAHDPDEENPTLGKSTLNGNTLNYRREPETEPLTTSNLGSSAYDSFPPLHANGVNSDDSITRSSLNEDKAQHIEDIGESYVALNHPRPSSAASSSSVDKLEREAETHSQAELAIKQHISTDLKSLFRLAKASGIDREEFERIVKRELDVLPLLESEMH